MKNDCIIRFLKRLNEQFASVKSQIMMMEPLPSINKVFSSVLQQERQLMNGINVELKTLVSRSSKLETVHNNFSNRRFDVNSGYSRSYGRGASEGFNLSYNRGSPIKFCTYCGKQRQLLKVVTRSMDFLQDSNSRIQIILPTMCLLKVHMLVRCKKSLTLLL